MLQFWTLNCILEKKLDLLVHYTLFCDLALCSSLHLEQHGALPSFDEAAFLIKLCVLGIYALHFTAVPVPTQSHAWQVLSVQ